jgi:small subunit ribosomal protein S21
MSEVRLKDKETIDSALKRFKRNCAKDGIHSDLRKHEHFESPSVRRRKKSEAARAKKKKFRI